MLLLCVLINHPFPFGPWGNNKLNEMKSLPAPSAFVYGFLLVSELGHHVVSLDADLAYLGFRLRRKCIDPRIPVCLHDVRSGSSNSRRDC